MTDRKLIQDLYIRVCKDSGWKLPSDRAAKLTADTLGISALDVALSMPYLSVMEEIATGRHSVCHAAPTPTT